jgi:hypothetical protein
LAHGEDSISGSGTSNKRAAAYYFCLPPPLLPSSCLSSLFLIWSDLIWPSWTPSCSRRPAS